MWNFKHLSLSALAFFALTSCNNVLRDFSDQTKDQYKIDSARKYIDEEKFDDAINIIKPVYEKHPSDPEIGYVTAVAYAGRGGLRIINLITDLVKNLGSKGALLIFAQHFADASADDALDIEQALTIIETVGDTPAKRNSKMNFFSLFIFYSRIGVTLARAGLDSGTLRSNFTACHTVQNFGAAMTGLSNANADTVLTSLARIVAVSVYVATGDELASLVSVGGIPAGVGLTPVCATTPNSATCLAVRTLINQGKSDSGIGLGVLSGNSANHPVGYVCASLTP